MFGIHGTFYRGEFANMAIPNIDGKSSVIYCNNFEDKNIQKACIYYHSLGFIRKIYSIASNTLSCFFCSTEKMQCT